MVWCCGGRFRSRSDDIVSSGYDYIGTAHVISSKVLKADLCLSGILTKPNPLQGLNSFMWPLVDVLSYLETYVISLVWPAVKATVAFIYFQVNKYSNSRQKFLTSYNYNYSKSTLWTEASSNMYKLSTTDLLFGKFESLTWIIMCARLLYQVTIARIISFHHHEYIIIGEKSLVIMFTCLAYVMRSWCPHRKWNDE